MHGQKFAPEATPEGGQHVTVMPDGSYRVNAGTMTANAQRMIEKYIKTLLGDKATNVKQIY